MKFGDIIKKISDGISNISNISNNIVFLALILLLLVGIVNGIDCKQILESLNSVIPTTSRDNEEDKTDTKNEIQVENPIPTLTQEEIRQKHLSNMISDDDLNIATNYTIKWIAVPNNISESKKVEMEDMVNDIQNYYIDSKDDYFIDSKVELTSAGTGLEIILEEGSSINLDALNDRFEEYKTRINIANSKVFKGKEDKLPYIKISNEYIENEFDQINELYNKDEIEIAEFRAYRLCKSILEDKSKKCYYRYIKENEELLKDSFNIILCDSQDGYSLNKNLKNKDIYEYGYVSEIVKTAKYKDGKTVEKTINDKMPSEYSNCKFLWNVSKVDDDKFIITYDGKQYNQTYRFAIYEYDNNHHEISTILELKKWNEQLKEEYKDHEFISSIQKKVLLI